MEKRTHEVPVGIQNYTTSQYRNRRIAGKYTKEFTKHEYSDEDTKLGVTASNEIETFGEGQWRAIMSDELFQERLHTTVIDEAHFITEWASDFRENCNSYSSQEDRHPE
ncbi:hypothetical protein LSAT2_030041 [Lamellibrachia satsuma]|nr:hypothetical protein LSAT2_030041 [Lamellibrachia satsuma]